MNVGKNNKETTIAKRKFAILSCVTHMTETARAETIKPTKLARMSSSLFGS